VDSPCIGAGKVISNCGGKDFAGNSVLAKPSIGAFEASNAKEPELDKRTWSP
jgi:hypothetical protein